MLAAPERSDEPARLHQAVVFGDRVDHVQTEQVRKDGRRIGVSLTVSPIRDAEGTVVGAATVAREITEAGRDKRENEERFHGCVEKLIDPLVLLRPVRDDAGRIVDFVYAYANDAARKTEVLGRKELVGRRVLELFEQIGAGGLFDRCASVAETGEPLALDDFTYPGPWGAQANRRFFDLRASKAGELLVLTWRDVTERHRAAWELRRLAAIVNLAEGFGRKTVAEGVETDAALTLLEQYGVDYAQGFGIGRPAPIQTVLLGESGAPRNVTQVED